MASNPGSAHSEVPAGGKAPFPPFQKDTFASQIVWLVIFFVALYLLVSRLALPRVGGIIKARQDTVAKDLAEAQRFKEKSDEELAAYESEMASARARAQAIGAEMRDSLAAKATAERKVLDDQLAQRLADAENKITATRKAAMSNVRAIATEATASIVQRLTGGAADGKAVEAAVDAALKG